MLKFKNRSYVAKEVLKGDFIAIIFYDLDKEHIKLKRLLGFCLKFRSKGINTKIGIRSYLRRIYVEQEFFLYGKTCVDAGVIRKKIK